MLVLMLGTLRGGATSISKMVSINDVPPLGYAFWQSLVAAVLLSVMAFRQTGQWPRLVPRVRYFLVCGLIGTAFPNVIFFNAVRHIPAGTMAVLLTLVPIMTYLLVVIVRLEKVDIIRLGGILLGLYGALLIALPTVSGGIQIDVQVLLAMLCPLGYALMGVYVAKRRLSDVHPFHLAAGTHVIATLFLLPTAVYMGQFHPIWVEPGRIEGLILFHGVLAAVAYSLFFKIVALAGAVFYSLSHYLIALTGLAWGWLLFGETHNMMFWLAVLCILSALTIVNLRQHDIAQKAHRAGR